MVTFCTSQVTELDTNYRKVYITAEMGASSYLEAPILGICVLDIDITDDKYPLFINWRSGLWSTPLTSNRLISVHQVSIGRTFRSTTGMRQDLGVFFLGYMNNLQGETSMAIPMGVCFYVRTPYGLYLKTDFAYYLTYAVNKIGVNVTVNYNLYHLLRW